jgi:NAD(P)-dependent dehydrogenase (short-subunit alcohol dehydrogenase family)
MDRLKGKVAIVTGGGSGMGRSACILFAKEGARVVAAEMDAKTGQETVDIIKKAGGDAVFVKTDVSNPSDCQKMVKTAVDTYGKLNVLFNNAGIIGWEGVSLADATLEMFNKVIEVNLKGVFYGMKYAIPEMLKAGGGSIINTSSCVVERTMYHFGGYCASKGGVLALSHQAAADYISQNIRVNAILPGFVKTPMLGIFFAGNPEIEKQQAALHPMGRLGSPDEVAWLVLFLASDESSYITAEDFTIDGGFNRLARA